MKYHFEHLKESFFNGRQYTLLYEKGIKETQNKPIETTSLKIWIFDFWSYGTEYFVIWFSFIRSSGFSLITLSRVR